MLLLLLLLLFLEVALEHADLLPCSAVVNCPTAAAAVAVAVAAAVAVACSVVAGWLFGCWPAGWWLAGRS